MSRSISSALLTAANAEQTGERLIFLVTITHETLEDPLRFCNEPTVRLSTDPLKYGLVSRGETYEFLPMTLQLPTDAEGSAPAIRLVLDNVTRQAVPLLRSIRTPAQVTVELLLASDLDAVEATWPEFDLTTAHYDALQVSLDLSINAMTTDSWPADTYTPAGFPALF